MSLFLAIKVSLRVAREEILYFLFVCFINWSLLGVCISFGHTQIGLFLGVKFKISNEHPGPLHGSSPLPLVFSPVVGVHNGINGFFYLGDQYPTICLGVFDVISLGWVPQWQLEVLLRKGCPMQGWLPHSPGIENLEMPKIL